MKTQVGKLFLLVALFTLLIGLLFGVLAAQVYVFPTFLKSTLGFVALRPMHVSFVIFWILLAASGCVLSALTVLKPNCISNKLALAQLLLWLIAIVGVASSYFKKDFGGREYWEFNPIWALPIAASWLLMLANFIKVAKHFKTWPVYVWMWMTGIVFFLFTFTENYLWLFPYFRKDFITDMTIQWKVNGSLVGAWNQIIYGTAFFLMDRISGQSKMASSKMAFAMFFLGLFNLMFNWGHHIYTLPTQAYIRYVGYAVSMTEWIFFARIIYTWKASIKEAKQYFHYYPYRFIMASNIWVFLNMAQAILMSIPAFNLYTHGTHVTVAHAMGTTIGINTMILFAACFMFLSNPCKSYQKPTKTLNTAFWIMQSSLLVFWLSLNVAGIQKGIWQNSISTISHHTLMQKMVPYFIVFNASGIILLLALATTAIVLVYHTLTCKVPQSSSTGVNSIAT